MIRSSLPSSAILYPKILCDRWAVSILIFVHPEMVDQRSLIVEVSLIYQKQISKG